MGESRKKGNMYIYDLPYCERKELCSILDMNNMWKELGGKYMKFALKDLERFQRAERCEKSPTDCMLQEWGQQNNTILELFEFLWRMGHFQAMSAIKSCVPVEYHRLFEPKKRLKSIFDSDDFSDNSSKGALAVVANEEMALAAPATTNSRNNTQHVHSSKGASAAIGNEEFATAARAAVVATGRSHPHQQVQEAAKVEVDRSFEEGATALPSSVMKYGSANLNQAAPSSGRQLTPEKVPQNFLHPYPVAAPPSIMPEPVQPNHPRYDGKLQPIPETEKIMNNRPNGRMPEFSCEDNNLKSMKSQYDPMQDYIRKAGEKQAKFLESEALRREEGNQIAGLGNQAKSKMNGTMATGSENSTGPSAAPPQHNAASNMRHHHQQFPPHGHERRISDASRHSEFVVPEIPYKELEEGTACWSKDNLLGRGGFGTVYKGIWKNSPVAVKKINLHGNGDIESAQLQLNQTLDELKLSQSFPHENILQIFGYSADTDHPPCLVYQLMPNGSVEDRLQLRKVHGFDEGPASGNWAPLSWYQRYNIALGTARALQYLHTVKERPLIHGDVKSANILLDKNIEPKLGDFGLAREGKSQSTSLKVSRIHGTKPYLPADYLRSKKLSPKVDTYSYGIVLFELCTGLRAYDEKRKGAKVLKDLVEETKDCKTLRDQNLAMESDGGIFNVLFDIAKGCVLALASRRPDMEKVFSDLENFKKIIEDQNRARKISMGEMCGATSSPYHLQYQYDMTAKSVVTPVSPTTQSSLPMPMYPSQVPSGATMQMPYSSLPSSGTYMSPHSPVPPMPPNSPVPPHYSPIPGGGYNYRHPLQHPHCMPWKQGTAGEPFQYVQYVPKIMVNGAVGGDHPPPYTESISHGGGRGHVVENNSINPMIPQLSDLNISGSSPHHRTNNNRMGSGYSDSGGGSSESSCNNTTAQSIVQGNPHSGRTPGPQGAAAYGGPHPVPTTNSSRNNSDAFIPLLTELGQTSCPPTAASKKSIFD